MIRPGPAPASWRAVKGVARAIVWGLLLATLAGCAALSTSTPPEPPPVTPPAADERYWLRPGLGLPSSDAVSLLHYYDYVLRLDAAQREDEQERLRVAWDNDRSDFRRLQYAITLGGPTASPADRRLALQLLEPIARDAAGHDPELHLLAILLFQEEPLERRPEAAREPERRTSTTRDLERKLDAANRELERRGEAMKEMERKLDAMKEIERQLLQRGRGPSREPRP